MAEGKNQKRLNSEYKQLTTNPPKGVIVEADKANPNQWIIHLKGPDKSPYEKGTFKISCVIPSEYPFKPPELTFTTKIYHPNIKLESGEICKDIYQKDWAPTKKIAEILEVLLSMMQAPNMEAPVEAEIAKEYSNNQAVFLKKCQEHIDKYAK
eukprot:TRINITY_DN56_c0_g1_i1.p2 TRINITY_DN56_c0_g1~~TRINITY_DN56_c0_g1_i1.p2  ORF type:complete len:153 (-),score=25.25 TRINITY_DN56_c0_g1_i1:251-709(-)